MGLQNSKYARANMQNYSATEKTEEKETVEDGIVPPMTPVLGNFLDPRSPNIYRTPLDIKQNNIKRITKQQSITLDDSTSACTPTKSILTEKLLRDLGYNFNCNDPRSPTLMISRTPIYLTKKTAYNDDSFDCSLISANDSCTDDANAATHESAELHPSEDDGGVRNAQIENNFTEEIAENIENLNTTFDTMSIQKREFLESHFDLTDFGDSMTDPRSPSLNVERTPIIIKEELKEDIIENIVEEPIITEVDPVFNINYSKPVDESCGDENSFKIAAASTNIIKHLIYEDENIDKKDTNIMSTPKKDVKHNLSGNRTPLGCLGNTPNGKNQTTKNPGKTPKHPTFFIQQNSTPKNQHAFANVVSNRRKSKIPVFKSTPII